MPTTYMFVIVIFYVNAALLFLLQPSQFMVTEKPPKISWVAVIISICLAIVVLFVMLVMTVFMELVWNGEGLPTVYLVAILSAGFAILVPLCIIISLGMKVGYDYLLPHLHKIKDGTHLWLTIYGIKVSLIIGFALLLLGIQAFNDYVLGRKFLQKNVLGKSLPPSITGVRYKKIRRYNDTSNWVKFTCADKTLIEKIQHELAVSDVCEWWGPPPPRWWNVPGRYGSRDSYANSEHLESYAEGERISFCYDTQNHVAYYHTIWRDF